VRKYHPKDLLLDINLGCASQRGDGPPPRECPVSYNHRTSRERREVFQVLNKKKDIMKVFFKLCVLAQFAAALAADSEGVPTRSLSNLHQAYTGKEMTFFAEFAEKKSKNPSKERLNCSWDNPNRSSKCPPVAASPFEDDGGAP